MSEAVIDKSDTPAIPIRLVRPVDAEAALQQSLQPFACVDPDPAPSMQWAWCPAWSPAGADPAHCAIAA